MSGGEIVTYDRTSIPDNQVVQYQEQQRLAPYSPEQRKSMVVHESARHIEGLTDENGMAPYHSYPINLAHGYTLPAMPAGAKVHAGEMYKNLSVFRALNISQEWVNKIILEYKRQWA